MNNNLGLNPLATSVKVGPGTNIASTINNAIAYVSSVGGGVVALDVGDYFLETAIILASNVRLKMEPETALIPTFAGGSADDPTNAVIKVWGALNTAKMNTTPASDLNKDAYSFSVTAPGTLAANDWVYIEGSNNSNNSGRDSDGSQVVLQEMIQVASVAAGTLTLKHAAMQFHSRNGAVNLPGIPAVTTAKAVTPILNVTIEGGYIKTSGLAFAVGVSARYCQGLRINGLRGAGFSRAMINLDKGTCQFEISGIFCAGEANSVVFCDSAISGVIRNVRTAIDGARYHANGYPRGLLNFWNRCTSIIVSDCDLRRGCIGIRIWGGKGISFSNIRIEDMLADVAESRGIPIGELTSANYGIGVDGGAGPLNYAQFAHAIAFSKTTVQNCRHSTNSACHSFSLHDWFDCDIDGLQITNLGMSPSTPGAGNMQGIGACDASGRINGLTITGVNYGFRTWGGALDLRVDATLVGNTTEPGSYSGMIGCYFDHGSAGYGPIIFTRLQIFGYAGTLRTGPAFYGRDSIYIDDYMADPGRFTHVFPAYNNTGANFAPNEVVELLGTASPAPPPLVRYIGTPGAQSTKTAILVNGATADYGTGWLFVSPTPVGIGTVKCTTAAVSMGDLLVSSGTTPRHAETSASPPAGAILGKALTDKPAGTVGFVKISGL